MTIDNIARADEIVGLKKMEDWPHLSHCWWAEDIRRTRYLKWLDENAEDAARFSFRDDIGRLAAGIVSAHAAKHPQPSDGLPPGPWGVDDNGAIADVIGNYICLKPKGWKHEPQWPTIAAYLARCGSPAVRSILAACDDAELGQWAKVIAQYQIDGTTSPIVRGEFISKSRHGLPVGEIVLLCFARAK